MKKAIFIATALVSGTPSWAQKPPVSGKPGVSLRSPEISRAEIAAFQKSLNITPTQKQKLNALAKKFSQQIRTITGKYQTEQAKLRKNPGGGTREARFAFETKRAAEMKPLIAAYQNETQAIYTPEQRKKMAAFQAQAKARVLKAFQNQSKTK